MSEIQRGKGTPFEALYALHAMTLLAGVGFDRCTSLHYAESLVPGRRTMVNRYLDLVGGQRMWVERRDMANDDGVHFPVVGEQFVAAGGVRVGRIGVANVGRGEDYDLGHPVCEP